MYMVCHFQHVIIIIDNTLILAVTTVPLVPPECLRIDISASTFQIFQNPLVWKPPFPNPVYAPV